MVSSTFTSTDSPMVRFKPHYSKWTWYNCSKQLTLLLFVISSCLFSSCTQNQTPTSGASAEQTTQSSNELVAVGSGSRPQGAPIVVPSDSLIVPGVSLGAIKLDADAAPVMKQLGKPDAADAAMGKAVATWFEQHDSTSHALSIFTAKDMGDSPTAIIKQIRVTAPTYKTEKGVGVSSTLDDIQQAFNVKAGKGYRINQENVAVYVDTSGIAFEMDKNGRCIGIVVYSKGDLHPDTYARLVPASSSITD